LRNPVKVVYLFATFPKLTETFLQREVRAMRELPIDLELFSLWGGESWFEGLAVRRFPNGKVIALFWLLPYWVARRPAAFISMFKGFLGRPVPSWKNLGETLVGIGFAITHAALLSKQERRPDLVHAVWATMPATAAQLLAKLTGISFTMGAHAYDVYQNGGDWLLPGKLQDAALIVTSTEMVRQELLRRGADPAKVVLVRRGLCPFPQLSAPRSPRSPLRVLSVARLVEKKGIFNQLEIFAEMKRRDIPFEAHMVGDGPLARASRVRANSLGLSKNVRFLGSLAFAEVLEEYAWADVFVFTGAVAEDGDRDGLPNVILEAMATGTPVIASKLGGTPELVEDGRNGILLSGTRPEEWIRALVRLRDDDVYYRRICHEGRASVEEHSDARLNAKALLEHFGAVSGK
jgi:glycosyltransferase involved in cell wall biosynthesis